MFRRTENPIYRGESMTTYDKIFELAKTIRVALNEYEVERLALEKAGITIFLPAHQLVRRLLTGEL